MKKQSKATMNGTAASPAEVFHRNLVDAVSNVEGITQRKNIAHSSLKQHAFLDSDENEHYVYPYSGNESNASVLHRPLSVRPASLLDSKKRSGKGFGEWLRQTLYNKPPQPAVDDEEEDLFWSAGEQQQQQSQQRRPKLRNHVKDHQQQSNKSSLLNLWHDSFNKKYAPSSSKKSSIKKYYSSQKHSPSYVGHGGNRNGGYTSDDEEAPLLLRRQKRSFSKPKKTW